MNPKWLTGSVAVIAILLGIIATKYAFRDAPAQIAAQAADIRPNPVLAVSAVAPPAVEEKPEEKPAPAKPSRSGWRSTIPVNPIVSWWDVDPVKVNGEKSPHGQHPKSIAVNDDGDRVVFHGHHAIDIWTKGSAKPNRIQHDWLRGEVMVAADASRFFVCDKVNRKLLTYHGNGRLLGSIPLLEKNNHTFLRLDASEQGHGCSPFVLADQNQGICGIYRIHPDKGTIAVEQKLHQRDYGGPAKIIGLENDEYLALYGSSKSPGSREPGIYRIRRNGVIDRVTGVAIDPKLLANHPTMEASPDGRYAAVHADYDLDIYDLTTAKRVYSFRSKPMGVNNYRFTSDGRVLIQKGNTYNVLIIGAGMGVGIRGPWEMEMRNLADGDVQARFTLNDFGLPGEKFAINSNNKYLALANDKAVAVIDVDKAFPKK